MEKPNKVLVFPEVQCGEIWWKPWNGCDALKARMRSYSDSAFAAGRLEIPANSWVTFNLMKGGDEWRARLSDDSVQEVCCSIGEADEPMVRAIASLRKLRSLTVCFDQPGLEDMLVPLVGHPELEAVIIGTAGDRAFVHIGRIPNLISLVVDPGPLTDEGLGHLTNLRLTHLVIAETKVSDAGMDAVSGMSELRDLNLSSTPITASGLRKLAALPNLEEFKFVGKGVNMPEMEAMKTWPSLVRLTIEASRIDEEVLALAMDFPKLRRLDIGRTMIDLGFVDGLRDKRPGLDIYVNTMSYAE